MHSLGQAAADTFNTKTIRVIEIDDQRSFVASDVCRALELDVTFGTSAHREKLDADEKRPLPTNSIPGKGMAQAKLVSQPGFYKLIGRSSKTRSKGI